MEHKESNYKLILSIAVLIVAVAISCYFFSFLPKTKQADKLSKNQADCLTSQNQMLQNYKKTEIESGGELSGMEDAINHYNKKLGKCIVEITDINVSGGTRTNSITLLDAVENKQIAWCFLNPFQKSDNHCESLINNLNGEVITEENFYLLEKQYMNE